MSLLKIFIVDDDLVTAKMLQYHLMLNPENDVEIFQSGKDCLKNLHKKPGAITLDYYMQSENGSEILEKIQKYDISIPVIIVSGQQEISTAVELLKNGAYDYVVKDDNTKERLWNTINHIRKSENLERKVSLLQEEVETKYEFSNTIVGESDAIKKIFSMMDKASKSTIVVSVTGETGTGKEMVAKGIHYNSDRKNKPFVAVNMAAIPKELVESELFGHEKGAFTGAMNRRSGKFEEAQGGTIFLDEIGDMDLLMQSKLLRVLQEQEVTRVGGSDTIKLDVRVIIATHKNLPDEVARGHFREDLYYRLMGIPVFLPPLRDRGNDIAILARHFIKDYCSKNKIKAKRLSPEAVSKLFAHTFPGNIRELKAIVDLAIVMSDNDVIEADHLQIRYSSFLNEMLSSEMSLEEFEKAIIQHYLMKYNNKVRLVADKLGIGKSTIYRLFPGKRSDDTDD